MLVMASLELASFLVSFVVFIVQSKKKGKQLDFKTYSLLIMFLLAYMLRNVFLWYSWMGPVNCRALHSITSFIFFLPTAIFFIIFIWTIFKLLLVWRGMVAATEEDALKERKRIQIIKLVYLVLWVSLWFTQRTSEVVCINKKIDDFS